MTPIHWYIRNGQDQQVVDVIRAYHAVYPQMIYQPDALGDTPLDVAIQVQKQQAYDTIRELHAVNRRALQQVPTRQVATPTETHTKLPALPRLVQDERYGYSTEELTFEYNYRRVEGMPDNINDYIKQRRWGCTCGACTEGWMSPRMRCRIASAAEFISDLMTDVHTSEFPKTGAHPSPNDLYPDVPFELHPRLTLEFWMGFTIVFEMIGILLGGTDLPLTEAAVLKLARRRAVVDYFLTNGGKVLHALDATMDTVWEQSARCDGIFEEINANDDEYNALPTCENDLNFELVRNKLGLPHDVVHEVVRWEG
ncbi:hypothetical protein C0995_007264 [Termitomyces sp. Mi166|nr:hypothetical protein C0995_007264 [Termitomyces sp. Mi166\